MEAKCIAGKAKQPEEIGLTLPHKICAVITYYGNIPES